MTFFTEAVAVDNEGVFIRLIESLVHDFGIIFVSSAGNLDMPYRFLLYDLAVRK